MSSHREAPAISSLTAFSGVPTLADLQLGGLLTFDELAHIDPSTTEQNFSTPS